MRSATWAARAGAVRRDQLLDAVGGVLVLVVAGDQLRGQRLRQLGAVAIERVGLEREAPGQEIGGLAILDARVIGHVDGLGDRAGDEGLRRRHHADVRLDREIALAQAPAGIGAVEHGVVFGLEEGRALQRHRAADVHIGGFDVRARKAQMREEIEVLVLHRARGNFQRAGEEIRAKRPFVEDEFDVEGARERLLDDSQLLVREALGAQAMPVLIAGALESVAWPTA